MKKLYTGLLICLMTTATIAQEIYPQIKSKDTGDDKNALFTKQNNPQSKSSIVYSNWETFDNVYRENPDKLLSEKKTNFGLSKNDELLLKSESAMN